MFFNVESANDISDQGVVVGRGQADSDMAFIWTEEGGIRPIDGLPEPVSSANAINNRGQIVGCCGTEGFNATRAAFLWDDDSGAQLLPLLGSDPAETSSDAWDINDRGDIVGGVFSEAGPPQYAVLWHNGEATDLGNLGVDIAWASAINDSGVIVGFSYAQDAFGDSEGHAFVWDEEHGMRDLNQLIDPPFSVELSNAVDINNDGWILATSLGSRIYLLKPVPEPGSTVLFLSAVSCLSLRFRVRPTRVFSHRQSHVNLLTSVCQFATVFACARVHAGI
jgi:probable HAF family extracellular repeat protein